MPTLDDLVDALKAQRREAVETFDKGGWTAKRRELIERLDRLIARYGG